MKRWYVVHTQTHQEARAELNLSRQGLAVWLPLFRRARRHARRIDHVLSPSFHAIFSCTWASPFSDGARSTALSASSVCCATMTHHWPCLTGWWKTLCSAATDPAQLCCRRAASPWVKPLNFRLGRLLILKACSRKCRDETVSCCC
jgi:hypothetical protein